MIPLVPQAVAHPNHILETLKEVCEEYSLKLTTFPKECNLQNEWESFLCQLKSPKLFIAFHIQQHPGCCAILDLSYVHVDPHTYGNFDHAVQLVEEAASRAEFGAVMMTQVVKAYDRKLWDKEPWIKGLDRGWSYSTPFRNAKSGNLVTILTKDLKQKGKRAGWEFPVNPPAGPSI